MRVLIQRVRTARVEVDGQIIGSIGGKGVIGGLLLLVGVGSEDDETTLAPMAKKVMNLRIFADDEGKMNRSLLDIGGEILAVSQFTLYGDCRKGRRPSFIGAAPPDVGRSLFDQFVEVLRHEGCVVETGQFGAMMDVHLVNDGPVTLWLDSDDLIKGSAADTQTR